MNTGHGGNEKKTHHVPRADVTVTLAQDCDLWVSLEPLLLQQLARQSEKELFNCSTSLILQEPKTLNPPRVNGHNSGAVHCPADAHFLSDGHAHMQTKKMHRPCACS